MIYPTRHARSASNSSSGPHSTSARASERQATDEQERDLARVCDRALVQYQDKWERKLRRLQGAYPARWRVPGLSEEEVRDALTLRLIEAVRTRPDEIEAARTRPEEQVGHDRPGEEWGLSVIKEHLGALRRSFRVAATPMDLTEVQLLQEEPSEEERWLEREADAGRALAQRSAETDLSRPQRRWLDAMKDAAHRGDFFQASEQLNLSAASRILGKNRSSAQRAYKEIQSLFIAERQRLAGRRP